jgi:lipoate-protein ligase A
MPHAAVPPFRVIDTGVRGGRANMAFDQALIEARGDDRIPDTIRFLRFHPAALIGRHQILSHEVDVAWCRAHGVELGRRITGGGALYLDQRQLGWELVFRRGVLGLFDLDTAARRICEAAAAGLRRLGIAAAYRPRNDIEVDGRKLGGTGGFFDGDLLFYQGTVLIDFDPAAMLAALRLPAAKLAKRGLASAADRIVTLRELAGGTAPPVAEVQAALLAGFAEGLGLDPVAGEIGAAEEALAQHIYQAEIGTDDFVTSLDAPATEGLHASAVRTQAGGSIRADLRCDAAGHIREALITGDFFVTPPRVVRDLEASLRGVATAEAGQAIDRFFATHEATFLGLGSADLRAAVLAALAETSQAAMARLPDDAR